MPKKSELPEIVAPDRVMAAADLLYGGARATKAAKAIAAHFGVCERTAWVDIKTAREQMVACFRQELSDIKATLWDYYTSLMELAIEKEDVRGGVAAAAALSRLVGADAPSKMELSGEVETGGRMDLSKLSTEELREMGELMRKARCGESSGGD